MRAHLMIAYSIMELLTWPVLAPAVLNTGTNLVVIEPLTAWGTELSSAVSRPASANDKNVVTHTHSGLATSWSWSSSSLASAFAAGRGAAQAPDRPQIHQPWATRRLLEATSSAVRPTTRTNSEMLLRMHRPKRALLLPVVRTKRRRLVATRKLASSATCFPASPAAEWRAS